DEYIFRYADRVFVCLKRQNETGAIPPEYNRESARHVAICTRHDSRATRRTKPGAGLARARVPRAELPNGVVEGRSRSRSVAPHAQISGSACPRRSSLAFLNVNTPALIVRSRPSASRERRVA